METLLDTFFEAKLSQAAVGSAMFWHVLEDSKAAV